MKTNIGLLERARKEGVYVRPSLTRPGTYSAALYHHGDNVLEVLSGGETRGSVLSWSDVNGFPLRNPGIPATVKHFLLDHTERVPLNLAPWDLAVEDGNGLLWMFTYDAPSLNRMMHAMYHGAPQFIVKKLARSDVYYERRKEYVGRKFHLQCVHIVTPRGISCSGYMEDAPKTPITFYRVALERTELRSVGGLDEVRFL